jgi:hypothetical protein
VDSTSLRSAPALHALHMLFGDPDIAVLVAGHWHTWGDLVAAPIADVAAIAAGRAVRLPATCPPLPPLPPRVTAVGRYDETYPQRATAMPAAPAVLFMSGPVPDLARVGVAGGRYASPAALDLSRRTSRAAGSVGVGVIAVLGTSIGDAALLAAAVVGAPSVAVAPYGMQHIGGPDGGIVEAVHRAGGVVISAAQPSTGRTATTLLTAQVLTVALCRSLVVTEASLSDDDGGLPSAAWALQLGRYLVVADRTNARAAGLGALGSVALSRTDALSVLGDAPGMRERSAAGRTAADAVVSSDADLTAALAYGAGVTDRRPTAPDASGWQRA